MSALSAAASPSSRADQAWHTGEVGEFGYVGAVLLAVVFARAGAAKLARRSQTVSSFVALRLPAAHRLAATVPVAELALAATLVAFPPVGGVAALVLLVAFTAVLVRAIKSGTTAPCNCFGSTGAEAMSVVDIVRNGMLAVLAVAATLAPAPTVPDLAQVVGALVLCGAGAGILALARRSRR